ncbi:MAG: BglG family transcription antiterminator [Erysipelotrichia bacterium]|jgi:mannitol operon transcriptional antiterminator|nr:BglG family transcription antiterminator [Erysipelotrichia bacterium]
MNKHLLSPRLIVILKALLVVEEPLSASALAQITGISKRTLFREISGCNRLLKPFDLVLETKTGKGLWLSGTQFAKDNLKKVLDAQKSSFVNKQQRQSMLVAELLKSRELLKLSSFSTLFDVSEGTISNDIDDIEDWFKRYHLVIERKPGVGVNVIGSEDDVRKAMTDFVHTQLDENNDWAFVIHANSHEALEQYFQSQEESSILNLLNKAILKKVIQALRFHANDILLLYAQSSIIGLIIHLTIALERLAKKEIITIQPFILDQLKEDEDFEMARRVAQIMEVEFNMPFPKAEVAYILMHLKGAKRRVLDQSSQALENLSKDAQIQSIVQQLISHFEAASGMILMDDQLHMGLMTHLRPTLTRLHYQLEIRNPLLDQIKKNYAQVFTWTTQAVVPIEKFLHINLPEDEIGYLAIHFGAAIERAKSNVSAKPSLKVGVVCASGIGISSLLSTRIMNLFPTLKSVIPLSVDDIAQMKEVDLLVSTLDLKHIGRDFVFVHPLLLDEDIKKIDKAIHQVQPRNDQLHQSLSLDDQLLHMANIQNTVLHAVAQLRIERIKPPNKKENFIEMLCKLVFEETDRATLATSDILHRESMGSIILEDAGIMLLHAKSKATKQFEFKIFLSETPLTFLKEANIKAVVFMLIQEHPLTVQKSLLSMINQSLIDDERFIMDIQSQNESRIRESVQRLCQTWLTTQTKQHILG